MEALKLNMLEEFEIEEYENQEEEVKGRFRITDLNQASWAFRKIMIYEKKMKEIEDLADLEISRIKEWKENESKNIKRSISFFEGLLGMYLMEMRDIDPKAKVTTPYGTVSSRKQNPQWKLNDEELLKWLNDNDRIDLIRVKEEPALSEIKNAFEIMGENVIDKSSGEIVSGIRIIDQDDKIVVKTK